MKYDRFKLEELAMSVRQVTEDLELMFRSHGKGLTEDELMNMIIGIQQLHIRRCDALFNCMEKLIEQGDLK